MTQQEVRGLNESFVFDQIRKYNTTRRRVHKDRTLLAVGIHAGILAKRNAIAPTLTPNQRFLVLCFLNDFCQERNVQVEFPELAELAKLTASPQE